MGHTKEARKGAFINNDQVSGLKTLTLHNEQGSQVIVVKSFNVPLDFPFDTSDKPFEIRYNDDMYDDTAVQEPVDAYSGYGGHGSPANYFSFTRLSLIFSILKIKANPNSIVGYGRLKEFAQQLNTRLFLDLETEFFKIFFSPLLLVS